MVKYILKVGDRVKVKSNAWYAGMKPGEIYQVVRLWRNITGIDAYQFKKVGKRNKPIGKTFSHRVISIDNSIESASRTVQIVKNKR